MALVPLALSSVLESTPGVHRSQLIQTGPDTLRLRLQVRPGADSESTWQQTTARLRDYLDQQGLPAVHPQRDADPPDPSARSGKFHQIIAVQPTEFESPQDR